MASKLLPGTEVRAWSLSWEVVLSRQLGRQIPCRIRGLGSTKGGREFDLLPAFDTIEAGAWQSVQSSMVVAFGASRADA